MYIFIYPASVSIVIAAHTLHLWGGIVSIVKAEGIKRMCGSGTQGHGLVVDLAMVGPDLS